tara:strand:- start:179 stop:505 length:327 start_codon:yes stop_codon:yes gene_type:complete
MIDWDYIRENYPTALRQYMSKSWTLDEFWNAYQTYVTLKVIEDEHGFELYDLKVESKLVMYSTLCYKSIIRDGKRIRVITFDEYQEKQINRIFKVIEDQIKDKNYLKN